MKLVIVSDTHLVAPGAMLFGSDPLRRLEACIEAINREHPDADLVVFAGDLTNDGEGPAYAALADRIRVLVPPHRMMLGNHDDRAAFRAAFPDAPDEDGFVQSSCDFGATRLILLDTLWPGHVAGLLCARRLAWLDSQLAGTQEALIVMHHPPVAVGLASLDEWRLSNPQELLALLQRHGNVRHIFAGHVHRLIHGCWNGIPFTTVRGTNHQSALKFSGPHEVSFEAPTYSLVQIDRSQMVVHAAEFATSI